MLMLVLGDNFIVMFVGWEGVGLCSYLLIGYWYERRAPRTRARRLIVNRIGDWGFISDVPHLLDLRHLDFAPWPTRGAMPSSAGFGTIS